MRLITIIISLFMFQTISAQKYQAKDIFDRANRLLKMKVGENVFKYFQLDSQTFYQYAPSDRWEKLVPNRNLRGKLIKAQIPFVFKNPAYKYNFAPMTTYIMLDSLLNLTDTIVVDFIPEFILNNQPSNWLKDRNIDKIIRQQNLKKSKYPIIKNLEFNVKTRKHNWIVYNTLYREDNYSKNEILIIDPVSGNIIEHKEEESWAIKDIDVSDGNDIAN